MAEVKPFKGILYNRENIHGDYSSVCAPPYDVISASMQDDLYRRSEFNVIRLILGKKQTNDTPESNWYTRAGKTLNEWIDRSILAKDKDEAFYIYVQEYTFEGEKKRRLGFIGLMEIVDPATKKIFPHENTLAKPKEDRMEVIKKVKGNMSPVFGLFTDEGGKVTGILEEFISANPSVIDATVEGERNRLWRLSDKRSVEAVSSLMKDKSVYIADGHHRYEVARKYRDMMRKEPGYDGSADSVMMYFSDMGSANDLTIMPTHRVVKKTGLSEDDVVKKLRGSSLFNVTQTRNLSEMIKKMKELSLKSHSFGFFGGKKYFVIEPKDNNDISGMIDEKKSREWKSLDVSILHFVIFKKELDVKSEEGNITYVKTPEEAEKLVKDGTHEGAFFLNPTKVKEMKAVAEHGDMMPQKSTYFYPKLLTGLVMHKFS
jgi:uncharacterized protein (DUF1015 family)